MMNEQDKTSKIPAGPFQNLETISEDTRLLMIDDDEDTLSILKMIFTKVGYQVDTARDGQEGLDLLRERRHDLVISDIMMPVINGYKFCEIVRNDPEIKFTPILLITAKKDLFDKVAGLNVGADDYMTKPYNVAELRARVASLLKMKRLRDDLIAREKEIERVKILEETLIAISHYVNNAIAPMAGRAQICKINDTEQVQKLIDDCKTGCNKVTKTINLLAKLVEWMKDPSRAGTVDFSRMTVTEMIAQLNDSNG